MSIKDLILEYSRSSTAGCKGCKVKIQKNKLRIGVERLFQDEHPVTSWYHLECFSLGKKYKDVDPKEIAGYFDLQKEDKVMVIEYFEGGGKKKSALQMVIDDINQSSKKKDNKKKGKDDDSEEESKQNKKNQKPALRVQPKRGQRRQVTVDSESSDDQDDYSETDDSDDSSEYSDNSDSDDDKKKHLGRKRASSFKGKQVDKKKKQQAKSKGKESQSNKILGYNEEQLKKFKEYMEFYEKKTQEYLKGILSINNQPKTGNKVDLVIKCSDGKVLGQIPVCQACGGGKLRFDYKTGIYKCPGYMDDDVFTHCNKKFTTDEIKREPWIDSLI